MKNYDVIIIGAGAAVDEVVCRTVIIASCCERSEQ